MRPLVDRAVVMRHGRIVYDGAPLDDHEVHSPDLAEAHSHHHRRPAGGPRARGLASPLDQPAGGPMSDLVALFSLPFMQRALLAAIVTGVAVPAVGTYLVQRRMSLMGDGLGHVAVTGVSIGLVTGFAPTWTAVVAAVLGAVAIEVIRGGGHQRRPRPRAALLRRTRRRHLRRRCRRAEHRPAPAVPFRLAADHLPGRRGLHAGVLGRADVAVRGARPPALRGRPGPGVRPGRGAPRALRTTCWSRCSRPSP